MAGICFTDAIGYLEFIGKMLPVLFAGTTCSPQRRGQTSLRVSAAQPGAGVLRSLCWGQVVVGALPGQRLKYFDVSGDCWHWGWGRTVLLTSRHLASPARILPMEAGPPASTDKAGNKQDIRILPACARAQPGRRTTNKGGEVCGCLLGRALARWPRKGSRRRRLSTSEEG